MSEEIMDKFNCPICLETPEKEIYQCLNGHIICGTCSTNLKECPQCREPYGSKKARNRVLEEILKTRKFDCPNTVYGCCVKLTRGEREAHLVNCAFRGMTVQICKHLGYQCEYVTDSRSIDEAILHFQSMHDIRKLNTFFGKIHLENFKCADFMSTGVWTPFLFQKSNYRFLFFAKVNEDAETLSCHCIQLDEILDVQTKYFVKFNISADKEFIEHTTSPTQLHDVEDALLTPSIQISGAVLKSKFVVEEDLQLVLMLLTENEEHPTFSSVARSDKVFATLNNIVISRQTVWPIVRCDGCKVKPVHGALHHCLQCEDYDLCNACWKRKVHAHHLVVTVRTKEQYAALRRVGWNADESHFLPLVPAIGSPLNCKSCEVNGRRRNAAFVCGHCLLPQYFCETCFVDVQARGQCLSHKLVRFWST